MAQSAYYVLAEVSEYRGAAVRVSATQLGTRYSAAAARRIVDEWVNFLAAGPSPIRELDFTSRTPRRLFEALGGQPQLRSLAVKWGDYSDCRREGETRCWTLPASRRRPRARRRRRGYRLGVGRDPLGRRLQFAGPHQFAVARFT